MQVQTATTALPPARPSLAEPPAGGDGAFAQLLARQPEVDGDAPAEPAVGTNSGRPDEARAARARQAGAKPPSAKTAGTESRPSSVKEGSKDAVEADDDEAKTEADASAVDPALSPWLPQLQRPQPDAEAVPMHGLAHACGAAAGRAGDVASEAGADAGSAPALQAGDGRGTASARAAAQQRHGQATDTAGRDTLAGAQETPARGTDEPASPAATTARTTPESTFVLPANPEPAAAAAVGAPATPAAAAPVEAPVSAAVPVPLDSAEFAEAFGVQVSVLARDGVQQAELHLNPAEMGPVSVQIAMDGERARIDFGAQAAATRAAIEASLPELAAALRDAGLTLAGGGVSQQMAGRGDDSRQGASDARGGHGSGRAAPVEAATTRPTWRGRVSAGGVDLYA